MNETIELLKKHQSCRKYLDKKLSAEQISAIEQACLQTSSTCFFQNTTIIRINKRDLLTQLSVLSGDQEHIAQCAEFWFFCGDFSKINHLNKLAKKIPFKLFQSASVDAALMCQNALTAAESLGLGGVIIGGFRNQIEKVSMLLKLPEYVIPVVGLCLGIPDPQYVEEQKPRLPRHWLILENQYQDNFNDKQLEEYNARYQKYNQTRKYNITDKNWVQSIDGRLPKNSGPSPLFAYYKAQGFDLE